MATQFASAPPRTLAGLSDPAAVRAALQEFDRIGRAAFLKKYGFRKARTYFVVDEGRRYDSKAIAGAAYGYQHPQRGPLTSGDFVGGDATVRPKLQSLGFSVIEVGEHSATTVIEQTSDRLTSGEIYSREALATMFEITDATLNTGVFQPSGSNSVWLFVTRDVNRRPNGTPDRRRTGTPFTTRANVRDAGAVRAACGVGRA